MRKLGICRVSGWFTMEQVEDVHIGMGGHVGKRVCWETGSQTNK
jgi:hypothetical protein